MNEQTITIREYLSRRGIAFREKNGELISRCLFGGCDNDSNGKEAHLYFNAETGQYHCKKCGEKGNIFTLAEHFGDDRYAVLRTGPKSATKHGSRNPRFTEYLVESCHQAIPDHIRIYLNDRGVSDTIIDSHKLGYGEFYGGGKWITIPIKGSSGNFAYFKLRRDPEEGDNKLTYPKGSHAEIYDWDTLSRAIDKIVICEGELDKLLLESKGVLAITSTHGASSFNEDWCSKMPKDLKCYICYDNDKAGRQGAERTAKLLYDSGHRNIFIIALPEAVGEGGDITDYFNRLNGNVTDLFDKLAKTYPEKIDVSQFKPLSIQGLIEVLGHTIKKDEDNKLLTFLCQLSAYTDSSQFNISYNAPSSTGKSYIPIEIARLFPEEDVIETAHCTPTAFFHSVGKWDKDKGGYVVDLSRKILIFMEQLHPKLLQHLRSLLSHDKKEILSKITDKNQKYGLRTKNVYLKGFPAVIHCTAGLRVDEQEATRFILLSPQISQEKIREAIIQKIIKESDSETYHTRLEDNPERKMLKQRIKAIRNENIDDVKIISPEKIEERFFSKYKFLKPRHQRDIGRILSLIKAFALLNLWFRERTGKVIIANEEDVEEAFKVWEAISDSQELNLPPYIYSLYREVIIPAWNEKGQVPLSKQEIMKKHYEVYRRILPDWQYRQQIIPMLEDAGLIGQDPDPTDKRRSLIYLTMPLTTSGGGNNSESDGGVNESGTEPNKKVT